MVDARDESVGPAKRTNYPASASEADAEALAAEAALLREKRDILQAIATGQPAAEVLVRLCRIIEVRVAGALGTVLLRNADGQGVHTVAAPSLPVGYCAQFGFLRDKGCDVFQGFLFARPQPAHALLEAVRRIQPPSL